MKLGESSSISYRPDVDGLRAIAVLAVLIFHFFPISLPGGYIGVDIFFVISGYLVTAILEQNIKSGRFSFYKFYAKRARRLFPALIAVLVAVLLIGLLLLVSDELESLSKHIFSGTIFISNFILYSESGYFDRSVELKPLMHLWSLAVEEQFYILWPVLIYLAFRKGEKFLKFSLTFVFAISLAASIFLTRKNPSMSFYLLPTRLWELAAGGLLASQGRGAWARICSNRWIGQVLPWLGLATCVYGFLKFDAHTTFPSYRALIPVLGTLLIVGSGERSFLAKVLSHPKVVYVGLISYPLYLWHWPLISFAYIFYNKENLPSSIVWILFALSFVIAAATYEWLEKPLKRLPLTKYKIGNVVLSLFGVGIIGSTIWSLRGLPSRFAEVENLRSSHLRFSATEETQINSECIKALFPIEMCAITEPSKLPTVVILGDSHANHFFPGLQDYYSKSGDNLALLAKSGTPPLVGVVSQRAEDSSLGDVFEFISRSPNVHTVILAAFWGNYFEESGVQVSNLLYKNRIAEQATNFNRDQMRIFIEGLERTLIWARNLKKRLIFVYNIAPLPFELSNCLPRPLRPIPQRCHFDFNVNNDSGSQYRVKVAALLERFPEVVSVDPVPVLCSQGNCPIQDHDIILYADEYHLSESGSHWLLSNSSIIRSLQKKTTL